MSEVEFEGWLTKQGHVNKNWKRRYFRLRNSMLSYYEDDQSIQSKGNFLLINVTVDAIPFSIIKRENCFSINCGSMCLVIQGNSMDEVSTWKSKIMYVSNKTTIIKTGTFEKLSSDNKKWDTRYFILVPGLLVYYNRQGGDLKGYCDIKANTIITKTEKDQTTITSKINGKTYDITKFFSRYSYCAVFIENQLRQLLIRFYDFAYMNEWYTAFIKCQQPVSIDPTLETNENSFSFDYTSTNTQSFFTKYLNDVSSISSSITSVQEFDEIILHICPHSYSEICLGRGHACINRPISVGCVIRSILKGKNLPTKGFQYNWQRTKDLNIPFTLIPNAMNDSYTVTSDDANCYIRVQVRVPFANNSIVERSSEYLGPIISYESPKPDNDIPKPAPVSAIPFPAFDEDDDSDDLSN